MISRDLLTRLRNLAHDEELPHAARARLRDAIDALASGGGDDVRSWSLYRAAEDLRRGLGSVEHVTRLARMITGARLVVKEGPR